MSPYLHIVRELNAERDRGMSQIVSTPQQVVGNIYQFQKELASAPKLQGRLSYARSWYAIRNDDGEWLFAPSKFIGYRNMTADEYLNDDPRDGRQTERKLEAWFTLLPESNQLYEELSDRLADFLAKYGKVPSTAMRLNILAELYEEDEDDSEREIADLIIAIVRRLPRSERTRVRAAI